MSLIDYAQHLIRLDQLCRSCHDLCLAKRYGQAAEEAAQIRAEARLLALTLEEMSSRCLAADAGRSASED